MLVELAPKHNNASESISCFTRRQAVGNEKLKQLEKLTEAYMTSKFAIDRDGDYREISSTLNVNGKKWRGK